MSFLVFLLLFLVSGIVSGAQEPNSVQESGTPSSLDFPDFVYTVEERAISLGLPTPFRALVVPGQCKTLGISGFENDQKDDEVPLPGLVDRGLAAFVASDWPAAIFVPEVFVVAALLDFDWVFGSPLGSACVAIVGSLLSAFGFAAMLLEFLSDEFENVMASPATEGSSGSFDSSLSMSPVVGDPQLAWETDLDGNGSEASGAEPASEGHKPVLAGSVNVSDDYVSVTTKGELWECLFPFQHVSC